MSDDVIKRFREAALSYIRARLRANYSMGEIRDELVLEISEALDAEVMRHLEQIGRSEISVA